MFQGEMPVTDQTIRTFWQGGVPSPYQRLSFKSFADRGCRVEVFSYDPSVTLPRYVVRRDAADVLPPERVLRFLPAHGQFAVNIDHFRYALLAKLGGWWIDPDVVLLGDALPRDEIFLAGPDHFGLLSTAVLKFPPQHPVPMIAEEFAAANASAIEDWSKAGAPFFTELVERHGLSSLIRDIASVAPIARPEVLRMFAPREDAYAAIGADFLDLHYDAWLQARVTGEAAPPDGSLLHHLLQTHNIIIDGPSERMNYGNLVQALAKLRK
jgi:hypothetical protein